MDNQIIFPFINPVKLVQVVRTNLAKYFTKHFDDYLFAERLHYWQQPEDYTQIWQTTDSINLQFSSTFNPIQVQLINQYGFPVITLSGIVGLPNKAYPSTMTFEVKMSLASVKTGVYYVKVTAGINTQQVVYISGAQYISETQIQDSLCVEYYNSRFHADIIFETGIKFQHRILGNFGFLEPIRKDEFFKNQPLSPSLLSSKVSRQFPLHFGDNFGLPDDTIDLLNRIWSCDNVSIDNKPFCLADGSKFEFTQVDRYPKRGLKLNVEEGVNRNSKIVMVGTDTNRQFTYGIMVDKKVFGDTGNQGSSNAVPVTSVQ